MGVWHLGYDYISSNGIVVADTSDVLSQVQTEWQSFIPDLDLTPSTPQGLIISALTLNRSGIQGLLAQSVNQFNPNYAGGIFLDAICALSGIFRLAATYTTVTATLTGTAGTIIPAGSLATTTNGDNFQLITSITIPSGGSITASFQAVVAGAIPCISGTLTAITSAIIGWTAITNISDGIVGINQQSDSALRLFRNNTLAAQSIQTTDAISSALYLVAGVTSLKLQENFDSVTETINGIVMVPHSIWVCVNGGVDLDVATAILENRSAGCAFNGATSIPVTASSGQIFNVLFDRPSVIGILVRVTVKLSTSSGVTSEQIQQSVFDYANGNIPNEAGLIVGANVSPFELGASVAALLGVYVKLVEIAPISTSIFQSTELVIDINQIGQVANTSSVSVIML